MPVTDEKAAEINIRALRRWAFPVNRFAQVPVPAFHSHTPEQNWISNIAAVSPYAWFVVSLETSNLNVFLGGGMPATERASAISEALEASRWILALGDDWDEQGSPAYSEATWQRVRNFLTRLTEAHPDLPAPEIMPGPRGSIDARWRTQDTELLLNFPSDTSKPPTFYGEGLRGARIEGNLDDAKSTATVAAWLLH